MNGLVEDGHGFGVGVKRDVFFGPGRRFGGVGGVVGGGVKEEQEEEKKKWAGGKKWPWGGGGGDGHLKRSTGPSRSVFGGGVVGGVGCGTAPRLVLKSCG